MVATQRLMKVRSREFHQNSLRPKKSPTFWQSAKKYMNSHSLLIGFLFFIMIFSGVFSFFMYLPSERRRMLD